MSKPTAVKEEAQENEPIPIPMLMTTSLVNDVAVPPITQSLTTSPSVVFDNLKLKYFHV